MIELLIMLGTIYFCCNEKKEKETNSNRSLKNKKSSTFHLSSSGYDPNQKVWWEKKDKYEVSEF